MKSSTSIELPANTLDREYHYHSPNPKTGLGEIGCGFSPRKDATRQRSVASSQFFGLIYLLRGGGKVSHNDGRPRRVEAGDVVQVPASSTIVVTPDLPSTWQEAFVTIDALLIGRVALINGIDLEKPVLRVGLDLFLVSQFRQITSELANATPLSLQGTLIHAIELVLAIHQMDRASTAEEGEEALIAKACRMLESGIEKRLDMEDVAKELGVGYHHFRRIFRKQLGVSPGQYRIYCRLRRARLMLQHEHKTVSEVASALGYADPFVFSKQFKKVVGQTPSEFVGR